MPPASLKRLTSTDREVSPPPAKRRVAASTTNNAVANFFKPTSAKEPESVKFVVLHDTLLVGRYHGKVTSPQSKPVKLAAFDFDDTLIATKSGNKFARGADDWKWWHATVPGHLKQLHEEGYTIMVMSNQAAVSLRSDAKSPRDGMRSLVNLKSKITAVLSALDLPITVYAATEHDLYRKPRTGMWEQMLRDLRPGDAAEIDHTQCVFVGDAAGRTSRSGNGERVKTIPKKDHSCSDRDLAANVGIPFHTPEEYFLGEAAQPFQRSFDPAAYLDAQQMPQTEAAVFTGKTGVELVLLCGSPGAGKSTYYWRHLQRLGYERVNQDILKSRDKCMKVAGLFIEDGKAVVVDNTNADIETRAAWVSMARKLGVHVRLIHFTAPAKLCEHNDTVRALSGDQMNPERRTMLPKVAFTGFAARYRKPVIEEGFDEIFNVDFKFDGPTNKNPWGKFWLS